MLYDFQRAKCTGRGLWNRDVGVDVCFDPSATSRSEMKNSCNPPKSHPNGEFYCDKTYQNVSYYQNQEKCHLNCNIGKLNSKNIFLRST